MREFLLSVLPSSILVVDISGAGRGAQFFPNHQFATLLEAEKFFLGLGASKEDLEPVFKALNENGMAKLIF